MARDSRLFPANFNQLEHKLLHGLKEWHPGQGICVGAGMVLLQQSSRGCPVHLFGTVVVWSCFAVQSTSCMHRGATAT